jgi:hypothetical protein
LANVRPRPRRMYFRLSSSLSKSTIRFPYLPYYCPTKPLLGPTAQRRLVSPAIRGQVHGISPLFDVSCIT